VHRHVVTLRVREQVEAPGELASVVNGGQDSQAGRVRSRQSSARACKSGGIAATKVDPGEQNPGAGAFVRWPGGGHIVQRGDKKRPRGGRGRAWVFPAESSYCSSL
jgi:hypothetical protein